VDLYLIRHADAYPLGHEDIDEDAERPLSPKGVDQCPLLAQALQQHKVRLNALVTSPLRRARQTAEGILEHWSEPAPELRLCEVLAPGGKRRKLVRYLLGLGGEALGLVGHMPDLADLAGWLIGTRKAQIRLAKCGVARISFEGEPAKGSGELLWLLTPSWYQASPSPGEPASVTADAEGQNEIDSSSSEG
jgi:phosphohistidine phosphatase